MFCHATGLCAFVRLKNRCEFVGLTFRFGVSFAARGQISEKNGGIVMWFGGDYYPEQWDQETIEKDFQLMEKMRVSALTVGVFSWTKMEPEEGVYEFDWLDKVLDRLHSKNIDVILATPTSGMPFWLEQKYPEIMRVDIEGRRTLGGERGKFCPNNSVYRASSAEIAGKLAERYGRHPAVKLWHINNEYYLHCYCPACAAAFRDWLRDKYGTLDEINRAWSTIFWNHTYTDFDQILPPSYLTEVKKHHLKGKDLACFQGLYLDYMRFMTHSMRACIENEKSAIRRHSDLPVTNNMSDLVKTYNYWEIAKALDVISWDSYPTIKTPMHKPAFIHDLMRSLKGQAFYVMEQNPNNVSWEDYGPVKRPGEVADIAWQGTAHGADANLFFQWRQSRGGVEKFHGAMVPHSGRVDTRMGKELAELGEQFSQIGDILKGAMPQARVAMLFDWENWWTLSGTALHNNAIQYEQQTLKYYRAFYEAGISVDIANEETCMKKRYDLIVAPCFYLCSMSFAGEIREYVRNGGTFLTTFYSGLADRNDNIHLGGYPGAFREVLGLWVEEIDALHPDMKNTVVFSDGKSYECGEVCDIIRLDGASAVALYGEDFYKGTPCVTEHKFGGGLACYIGTSPEYPMVKRVLLDICERAGIPSMNLPENVELSRREKEGKTFTFLLNHNNFSCNVQVHETGLDILTGRTVSGLYEMQPRQTMVLST
jgi:beta-galactosidase